MPPASRYILFAWTLGFTLCCAVAASAQTAANGPVSADVAAPQPQPQQPPADPDRFRQLAEKLANPAQEPAPAPEPAAEPAPRRAEAPIPVPAIEKQPLGTAPDTTTIPNSTNATSTKFDTGGGWILNTLTALGLVIALILLLRWGWSRVTGRPSVGQAPGVVEVLSRTAVAPRNHVLLLRVGGRILIVGDSTDGLRTLADIDDPDEIANLLAAVTSSRENSISRNFTHLLQSFQGDYETGRNLGEEGGDSDEHLVDRARDRVSGLMSRIRVLSNRGGQG